MAASDTSLALPVPGGGDAASTSRAFHFPYSVAYDIQLQLMTRLFETIEQGHIGVFESPTGTVRHTLIQGKTLSLLCSAFTWLEQNRRRAQVGTLSAEDSEEPEWVVAHDQARQRETLEAHDAELAAKLREIRHQRTSHAPRETTKRRVRLTLLTQRVDDGDDSDSDYLVADYDEHRRRAQPNDQAYLSDEVRRMMQALESCSDASKTEEETAITPKIYYASRTHSQLTQLIHELKRTPFGSDTHDPVRSISLGSRKQMCIHSQVQRIGATFGTEAMNERCLELMESGKKRCPYLPAQDAVGEAKMDLFRDHALVRCKALLPTQAHIRDIEELVALGKNMHTCPYFGARRGIAQAQLVTLPYNLLLQQDARDALALPLDNNVIIIDEAHNLIDTLLATYSVELSQHHIEQAAAQVKAYLERFAMRLKGTNEEHLRTLQVFLAAVQAFCVQNKDARSLTTAQFVSLLGGSVDQINVRVQLPLSPFSSPSSYASSTGSRIRALRARCVSLLIQISGYADKLWLRKNPHEAPSKHNKVHAMHLVEHFLLALGDRTANGRILISHTKDKGVNLKYILLNPADAFRPLLEAARSVVLAGGTMEPISEFQRQLLGSIAPERFTAFSCGHIVPRENVLGAVVNVGPKGRRLEFTHHAWSDGTLLDELGNALSNYCNIVPHGIIVFFPSYGSLSCALLHWKKTSLLDRLTKRKRVFQEPAHTQDVDAVLQGYASAIASPTPESPKGAILFAVVNAKLSEGINFQDDLARCVVMIGLPFPNTQSRELTERMEYMRKLQPDSQTDLGRELYLNLCMRAVNQSMGTQTLTQAAFLLMDYRFGRKDIASRMPKCRSSTHTGIGDRTTIHERFGSTISALANFYRARKSD